MPNANWLRPGIPSAGQQAFGDALLREHAFVLVPSVVSPNSWNLVFVAAQAVGRYACGRRKGLRSIPGFIRRSDG